MQKAPYPLRRDLPTMVCLFFSYPLTNAGVACLMSIIFSRNCTKHNCRCDYQDVAATQSPPTSRRGPDLLMSPEIEMEIDNWHQSGIPPYHELMQCPRSGWTGLSRTDLRLVHHIIGLSIDLHRRGLSTSTVWAQKMPKYVTD